jgi:hypothetical protein
MTALGRRRFGEHCPMRAYRLLGFRKDLAAPGAGLADGFAALALPDGLLWQFRSPKL